MPSSKTLSTKKLETYNTLRDLLQNNMPFLAHLDRYWLLPFARQTCWFTINFASFYPITNKTSS